MPLGCQGGEQWFYGGFVGVGVAEEDALLIVHVSPRRLMP